MSRTIPPPYTESELKRFLDTFLYREEAFLVDDILVMDAEQGLIEARMDTQRPLPFAAAQRTSANHPAHVAGAEIIQVTGGLGCLHAWFFHGCRWDEGWAGFGTKIERAEFLGLARLGPPLELRSTETRVRAGRTRVLLELAFEFRQGGQVVYRSQQGAFFLKDRPLDR